MALFLDFLIIIPARKGSTRLVYKNRKKIMGKSLSEITIKFACYIFPKKSIFFSTNDSRLSKNHEINKYGINILNRSDKLSKSNSSINDVILEIINTDYASNYNNLVLLQPTSPIRSKKIFLKALNNFQKSKMKSIVSAKCIDLKFAYNKKAESLKLYKKLFIPNGNFYISNIKTFKAKKSFYHSKTKFFEIDDIYQNIDIDKLKDFKIAKRFLEKNKI